MTPKEKAIEIANAMFNGSVFDYKGKEALKAEQNRAKQCALIVSEKMIEDINKDLNHITEMYDAYHNKLLTKKEYWDNVKSEIFKL
jgi:uncharacterized protein YdaT